MKNIFLIGFMGCGKSTIARYMSKNHGYDLWELDEQIEFAEGMKISQIFDEKGETYFRNLESQMLREIQTDGGKIISCGGGVVLREENIVEMKKKGTVIWLIASPETILDRVSENDSRPLLQGKKSVDDISEMLSQRKEKYEAAADMMIQTDQKSLSEICKEILENIKE